MKELKLHSLLSPSASHRWLTCTPSARIEAMFPDKSGEAAEEGTLAHRLAEISLRRMLGFISPDEASSMLMEAKTDGHYTIDMCDYVSFYVDAVNDEITRRDGEAVGVEQKIFLSEFIPGYSVGTVDAFVARKGEVHIFDLKYGKGVKVDSAHNTQLMIYALGICDVYKKEIGDEAIITLHIVQPRLNTHSTWQINMKELYEWCDNVLKPNAIKAYMGDGDFVAGEHCRFCKANGVCRKLAEEASGINDKAVSLLSVDEISDKLAKMPVVEMWCKSLQEHALRQALNGVAIPNYKVVEGRSIRRYTDEATMLAALKSNGIDEEVVVKRSLISLTELEKLLGKKEVSAMYSDFIVRPAGKPTLVPVTDKREAINVASDFDNIILN